MKDPHKIKFHTIYRAAQKNTIRILIFFSGALNE
jgi:hypothetical protein